ncbi:hypothetical protein B0T22DRAFT_278303 [Podospora appendiculata]|uniref:Uncharacterized protein n=1 Tax=Podospora appendiculata TaxID=314037 RepID=A0AAE0X0Y6_9PEZI|nr:hypothetical protein B0T22DRAFT_278303 [Podospora appendiculata]
MGTEWYSFFLALFSIFLFCVCRVSCLVYSSTLDVLATLFYFILFYLHGTEGRNLPTVGGRQEETGETRKRRGEWKEYPCIKPNGINYEDYTSVYWAPSC